MRIKSLSLIGFKSFYNKTTIHFHPGVNTIVGPNGCGKSNAIDSIKWVLGEQNPRRLRAQGMEQIISNGGSSLKPLGMAEVTLVVSSAQSNGFEDHEIKRRLYRSGESEYFINGVPSRLKDVADIFLDTGSGARAYTVIDQGKVHELVTANPENRRALVEQVAGIQKYKIKRRETQSRIESTRDNLERVGDLVVEIDKQKGSLDRQARQAEQYKKLSQQSSSLEYNLLNYERTGQESTYKELETERLGIENESRNKTNELKSVREEMKSIEESLHPSESEIDKLIERIESIRADINSERSSIDVSRSRIMGLESYTEKLFKEIELLRSESKFIESQVAQKMTERSSITEDLISWEGKLKAQEGELEEITKARGSLEHDLEATRSKLFAALDGLSSLRARKEGQDKGRVELELRASRNQRESTELSNLMAEIEERIGHINHTLEQNEQYRGGVLEEKHKLSSELDSIKIELTHKREEGESISKSHGECVSRLNALRQIDQGYEWLPEGLRSLVTENTGINVLGILADFVTVTKGYEKALEAALGEMLRWIIVSDNNEALKAVENLKQGSSARGTIFPLDQAHTDKPAPLALPPGISLTPLTDLVKVESAYEGLILTRLGRVFVVESLNEALSLRSQIDSPINSPGISFVTTSGEMVHPGGAISGGAITDGVIERRSEIGDLETESARLDENLSKIRGEIGALEDDALKIESGLDGLERELVELDISSAETKKDIENLRENHSQLEKRGRLLKFEADQATSEIEEKKKALDELTEKVGLLENSKSELELKFGALKELAQKAEERGKGVEKLITNLKVEEAGLRQRQNALDEDIGELDVRYKSIVDKIEQETADTGTKKEEEVSLLDSIEQSQRNLHGLQDSLKVLEKELEDEKRGKDAFIEKLRELEGVRETKTSELESLRQKLTVVELEQKEIEVEIGHLDANIEALKNEIVDLEDEISGAASLDAKFDLEAENNKLVELKQKLERFGPVNLLAPEEYDKLVERHEFLTSQVTDLEDAMSSLDRAMKKIDIESQRRFKEGFEEICAKFKEVFSTLFRGGEGKLILTDPDNLLETDVELEIRPRGKKFQPVNLLSGGEKALAGIALIISACLVRPAPFLLLDEIDAPLDDTNIVQFADLLKEIASKSQVLIVTHNKKTMQTGGSLIGITSDQPGVSRVVSVQLNEN